MLAARDSRAAPPLWPSRRFTFDGVYTISRAARLSWPASKSRMALRRRSSGSRGSGRTGTGRRRTRGSRALWRTGRPWCSPCRALQEPKRRSWLPRWSGNKHSRRYRRSGGHRSHRNLLRPYRFPRGAPGTSCDPAVPGSDWNSIACSACRVCRRDDSRRSGSPQPPQTRAPRRALHPGSAWGVGEHAWPQVPGVFMNCPTGAAKASGASA
jgi:hypothetical protein